MNQSAIALAADSAATRSEAKIFTANKIFALSKHHPIAVMIYGAAACMQVPWETVIKEFRADLGDTDYAAVDDYGEAFLKFIGKNRKLFPEGMQEELAFRYAAEKFMRIQQSINEAVKNQIEQTGKPVTITEARRLTETVIKQRVEFWRSRPRRKNLPRNLRRRTRERYGNQIVKAREQVFEKLPLTGRLHESLMQVTLDSWSKQPLRGQAGIVLAGFGRDDMFPALASYEIDGVLLNAPVAWRQHDARLDHSKGAMIVPFAQDDMIRLFIEGVTPAYEEFIESYFGKMVAGVNVLAISELPDGVDPAAVSTRLEENRQKLVANLSEQLLNQRASLYVEPMLSIVASLPMDELASLAESLVNLTSLRRRISLDQESVGGPIDVAVISRGDGLVWIKRKHYFPQDLNHQFFANYFGSKLTDD